MKRYCILTILLVFSLLSAYTEDNKTLRLTFIGDIMVHDTNYLMRDYNKIYTAVKDVLLNDDLSFANLEFPIHSGLPFSTYPQFNARPNYVQAAIDAGIEVFSLANNHSADQTEAGMQETVKSMESLNHKNKGKIYYSGVREIPKQEFDTVCIKKNGLKIGFLALTQFLNINQKQSFAQVVDYNNSNQVNRLLAYIRLVSKNYDLFIVSYHGGKEYSLIPDPLKVVFFHNLLKSGVHIVYGHHPHVLQPYEVIEMDGVNKLILYSAGNFISGQTWGMKPADANKQWAFTGDSAMFSVEVAFDNRLKPSVTSIYPVLISNYISPRGDTTVHRLEQLVNTSLPGGWSKYYEIRLKKIEEFFKTMGEYLN